MSGKFALVIGNSEYTDPHLAQLTAPGKDAEDFARVLRDPNLCGFDDVRVSLNQLSSSVIESIDEFFDLKKPDDLLVLYFSGHGIRDEVGSLYLAFKNTVRSRMRSTAIKADYIREAMDESRSKRQILVLDCCNSGAFSQGTKAEVGASMGMMTAFQGYGRYVLTASDATQYAWEGDRIIGQTENSLFTHFLVKGLEGEADNDGDGRITVDDLYHYAFEEISQLTPSQTPTKSASKQAGEIVLRQITRIEDTKPVSLPDDLIEAIQDERPFVREGAVHQLEKLLMGKNLGRARSAKDALEGMAAQDDSFRVRQAAGRALAPFHQAEERAQQERKAKDEAELASAQRAQPARSESEQESSAEIEANQLAAEKQAAEIKRKADLAAQQKTALAAIEAGHWQIAQGLLKGLLEDYPGNSEALELMRRVEAEIRGANEQRLRQDQIAALYKQAHGFIRARQWGDALKALDEIRGLDERFVDKDRLADKANDELHREAQATQRQALLAALYGGAVRAVEEGRYQDALDSWQRIESIDPNYRDSSRVRSIASRGLAEHAPPPARARRWALLEGVNPTWWIVLGAIGFGLSRLLDIDTIHGTIPAETWLALRGMVDGAIAALLLQGMLRVWNWKSIIAWILCWAIPYAISPHMLPGPSGPLKYAFTLAVAPTLSILAISRLTNARVRWITYAKILAGWFLAWTVGQEIGPVGVSFTWPFRWAVSTAVSGGFGLWLTVDALRSERSEAAAQDKSAVAGRTGIRAEGLILRAFLSVVAIRVVAGVLQDWLQLWRPNVPVTLQFIFLFVLGGLYGAVVALALRRVIFQWGWWQSLVVIVGWSLALSMPLIGGRVGLSFMAIMMAFASLPVTGAIKAGRPAISGFITALIFVSWAFAWKYGNVLGNYLEPTFGSSYTRCFADATTVAIGLLATLGLYEYGPNRFLKLTLLASLAFAVGNLAASGFLQIHPFDYRLENPLALLLWGSIGGVIFEAPSRDIKRMLVKGATCALGLVLGYYLSWIFYPIGMRAAPPEPYMALTNMLCGAGLGLAFALSTRRSTTAILLAILGAWMFLPPFVADILGGYMSRFFGVYVIDAGNLAYDAIRGGLIGIVLGFGYAYAAMQSKEGLEEREATPATHPLST